MTEKTMKAKLKKEFASRGYENKPRILLAAAECSPFAKTGGLADVVGTLPSFLNRLGFDARVIIPYHRIIKDKYAHMVDHILSFSIDLGWRSQYVGVETMEFNKVRYYLIDNEYYFGDKIYRGDKAEGEQYAFFQRAVLEALPLIDFIPSIIHCNDWHTALLPMLIKTQYNWRPQGGIRSLLTIHNIAYQGKFGFEFVNDLLGIDSRYNTPEFMENYGCISFLKAGCVFADKLSTVSPTYANEVKMPFLGEGLEGILSARSHDLWGIVNGIDVDFYNPETDPALPCNYNADSLEKKSVCKAELYQEVGIHVPVDRPLIAMVTRMTEQKGFDLIVRMLDEIMCMDVAFVLLGSGDQKYEQFMRDAENRHKGRVCSYLAYNEDLAHRIYAASDLFLMPSKFEPCGLSQMIAMRYGSLPIVRETGGLKDTVIPYNQYTGEGTGFTFTHYNAHEMLDAIRRGVAALYNPEVCTGLRKNAMATDFSFLNSAYTYARLFTELL
jgi:starch synthase